MAITTETLQQGWVRLQGQVEQLRDEVFIAYLPVEESSKPRTLWYDCVEITFYSEEKEVWCDEGKGRIELPPGVSAVVFRGKRYIEE